MRPVHTFLLALAAFVVGGVLGRMSGHWFGANGGEEAKKPPSSAPSKKPVNGPKGPPPPAAPALKSGSFEFEGMDFDTKPDFSHPSASFPAPVKIFFRLRLKDLRGATPGTKKANISYRRLGKDAKQNGPVRELNEEDLKRTAGSNEVIAYKPGLTFMASPPKGETSFEVYVDGAPVGRASFKVDGGKG